MNLERIPTSCIKIIINNNFSTGMFIYENKVNNIKCEN